MLQFKKLQLQSADMKKAAVFPHGGFRITRQIQVKAVLAEFETATEHEAFR